MQSKGKCTFFLGAPSDAYENKIALGEPVATGLNGGYPNLNFLVQKTSSTDTVALFAYSISGQGNPVEKKIIISSDGTITFTKTTLSAYNVYVMYYNDTEIT